MCRHLATNGARWQGSSRLCRHCQLLLEPIVAKTNRRINIAVATVETAQQSLAAEIHGPQELPIFFTEESLAAEEITQRDSLEQAADEVAFIEESDESLSYPTAGIAFEPTDDEFLLIGESSPSQQEEHAAQFEGASNYSETTEAGYFPNTTESHDPLEAEPSEDSIVEAEPAAMPPYTAQSEASNYQAQSGEAQVGDEYLDDRQAVTQTAANDYTSATDPWAEPLPAWDQSQHEWPVMLAPKRPAPRRKFAIAVIIALAIVSAIAVYLFFFFQPGGDSRNQKPAAQKPITVQTPATNQSAAPAINAAEQPSIAPDQKEEKRDEVSEAAASEIGSGQFSLQIASMPNERAANEMAAQLKEMGLPAYVVSADLGRRGVWYRVRVGRFETAEQAQRFAAESKLRGEVAKD